MNRKKFFCLDCGVDTGRIGEYYMLIDETWHLTGLGKIGMLCIDHVESRIGRKLNKTDFNNSYLNKARTGIMSQRLCDRMENLMGYIRTGEIATVCESHEQYGREWRGQSGMITVVTRTKVYMAMKDCVIHVPKSKVVVS